VYLVLLYAAEQQEAEEQEGKYHAQCFMICLLLVEILIARVTPQSTSSLKHSLVIEVFLCGFPL
jgi:hypothetical protein